MSIDFCIDIIDITLDLEVYLGDDCDSLSCIAHFGLEETFCGYPNWSSSIVDTDFGKTYRALFVRQDGVAAGNVQASIKTPASNDDCDGALTLSTNVLLEVSLANATTDSIFNACGQSDIGPGLWFNFTGTANPLSIEICGDMRTYIIYMFEGSTCSAVCFDFAVRDTSCSVSPAFLNTTLGIDYQVLILPQDGVADGVFEIFLMSRP